MVSQRLAHSPKLFPESGMMLVALALVLALATLVLSGLFIRLETSEGRQIDTSTQLIALEEAIRGMPPLSYGYLGDMGGFPISLNNLIVKPGSSGTCPFTVSSVPTYNTNHRYGVGMGWNGPYVDRSLFFQMTDSDTQFLDQWGTPLSYTIVTSSTDATLPIGQRYATITSAGPDAILGTADDLVSNRIYEKGDESITVQMGQSSSGTVSASISGTMWYACDGTESPSPLVSSTVNFSGSQGQSGFLDFPVTHHGPHAILITSGASMHEPSVIEVLGGVVTKTDPTPTATQFLNNRDFQCMPTSAGGGPSSRC